MLHINQKKEQFNIAYICALAAQAGLNHSKLQVDDDSVDIVIQGRGFQGRYRNPQIQLQLKCTAQDIVVDSVLRYSLKKKNYDDLRGHDLVCPRYLAVLLVPPDSDNWINQTANGFELQNFCYWVSLRDAKEIQNESITVEVPMSQLVTSNELLRLLTAASLGQVL
jgi:Domain of unknown function (DUF4365)